MYNRNQQQNATTLIITHILEKAGLSVKAVGNIGESYSFSVASEERLIRN